MAVWILSGHAKANANGLGAFTSDSFFQPSEYTATQEENASRSTDGQYSVAVLNGYQKNTLSQQIQKKYPVKDQGDYSTCWAFSLASAAEINLYKKGITTDFLDLSESHLAYFFFNRVADKWGRTNGDTVKYVGSGNYLDLGNDSNFAIMALANWVGFADEKDGNYNQVASSEETFLRLTKNEKIALQMKDQAHLNNVEIVNSKNRSLIKRKLEEYGAATTGIYYDEFFYNKKKGSYYSEGMVGTNHAVTCIGYNDNYSRNNFRDKPKKNGAWLMLNSWGDEWGNQGYFWVSYYDESLRDFNFIDVSLAEDYDTAYQYDGSSGTYYKVEKDKAGCANVYTSSKKKESLEAVSFYTLQDDIEYKVRIYTGFKDTENKGMLIQTISGKQPSAGYHTVQLKQSILLEPGTVFAVEVEYGGTMCYIPYDRSYTVMAGGEPAIKFVAKANKGESYSINSAGKWSHSNYNYRIKAFTTDVKEEITHKKDTIIEFYNGNKKISTVSSGQNGQLYPLKPYVRKGYQFVGWYTEPQCKNKVNYILLDGTDKKLYLKEKLVVGKVSNLKCTKYSGTTLMLTWSKASNAKAYEVYQYNETKKKYERRSIVSGNSYKVTKLKANTKYKFKVRAVNKEVKGTYSNTISTATTLKRPVIKLTGKKRSKTLKISQHKMAGNMEIYIKQGNGSFKRAYTVKVTKGKVKKKTISLNSKKTYTIKVRMFIKLNNKKYYSGYSKTVKVNKTNRLVVTA